MSDIFDTSTLLIMSAGPCLVLAFDVICQIGKHISLLISNDNGLISILENPTPSLETCGSLML
jgi:hypothetical protein